MDIQLCIHPRRILSELLRRWTYILMTGILAFALVSVVTFRPGEDVYRASSTVYAVATTRGDATWSNPEMLMRSASVIKGYSQVATSMKVLNRAAEMIGNDEITGRTLSKMVSVRYSDESPILTITVRSTSPEIVTSAANAVAESFVSEIRLITAQSAATVLDTADMVERVSSGVIDQWMLRIISAIAAMAVFVFVIVVKDIFSTKIYLPEEATLNGDIELLGVVPTFRTGPRKGSA